MSRSFADLLADLRKSRRLTRSDLAQKVGVSYSIVRRWEEGSFVPSLHSFFCLVVELEVTTDEYADLVRALAALPPSRGRGVAA